MANNKELEQQKVAATLISNIGQQYAMAAMCFTDSGERSTLALSVAAVGLASTAVCLIKGTEGEAPSSDDMLFTCLFAAKSITFRRDGTLEVEFAVSNIISTLEQFQEITGRSMEDRLNPGLMLLVNDLRNKAAFAFEGDLSKFRPQ